MFRSAATAAVMIAWVMLGAPAATILHAQQAPTDREVAVYAGLHAAAGPRSSSSRTCALLNAFTEVI